MKLLDWLRPPRMVLTFFLSLILACAVVLGWLGWQFLVQDRALERQRAQELLEGAADRVVAAMERELARLEEALRPRNQDVSYESRIALLVSDGKSMRVHPANGLAWYPWLPAPRIMGARVFQAAEELEFQRRDFDGAAAAYRRLAASGDEILRAEALVRLGRVLRRIGSREEALTAYSQLSELAHAPVAGMPAGLVAREASLAIMKESGRMPESEREAQALLSDLLDGRWPVTRASFEVYRNEMEQMLKEVVRSEDQTERIARAEAAEILWQEWRAGGLRETGRRILVFGESPVLALWRSEGGTFRAGFAGGQFMRALCERLNAEMGVSIALTDQEGRTVSGTVSGSLPAAMRPAAATRLPWTLHVRPVLAATEDGTAATRRRLVAMGLGVFAVLLLGGSYFVARAMNREMAVARLQSDFVAAVSHEFRTPLSALRQLSEMLAQGRIASAEQRQSAYETMAGETERLRRLVEGLLDFGRMEAGAYGYRMERIDATLWARQVASQFEASVKAKGYRVSFSSGIEAATIRGDAEALSRALWNLLDNAVKYSRDDKAISVEVGIQDERLAVCVRDCGVGIPADELKSVFDRFYRGTYASMGGVKGTGIGLAIVREILRAHGGDVRVESEWGKGSTFTLVLPREDRE